MNDDSLLPPLPASDLPANAVRYRIDRPTPQRRPCPPTQGVTLQLETLRHSVRIPRNALQSDVEDVTFELSHTWEEGAADQPLMVTAHRITGDGRRTGYQFKEHVTIQIVLPRNKGDRTADRVVRKYKWNEDGEGGGAWEFVREITPDSGQGEVVQFKDDSFSGYIVVG